MGLFPVFINLTYAFETFNREALWVIITKFGCAEKFIHIIWLLYDGIMDIILSSGDTSTLFNITNGVKQGGILLLSFST